MCKFETMPLKMGSGKSAVKGTWFMPRTNYQLSIALRQPVRSSKVVGEISEVSGFSSRTASEETNLRSKTTDFTDLTYRAPHDPEEPSNDRVSTGA
jgi:hypothetical protein